MASFPSVDSLNSNPQQDSDIQVINRDHPQSHSPDDFLHPNVMDLLNFIPQLDIPTPSGSHNQLFDDLDPSYHHSSDSKDQNETNHQHPAIPFDKDKEPSFSPSLSPMPDFAATSDSLMFNANNKPLYNTTNNNEADQERRQATAGALTRFNNNPLPPMPSLSEPVIPNTIPPPPTQLVPDYIANGVTASNRNQMMLSAASKKKKELQGPKTRPAFVMKIWSMVNDPENHEYIRWNEDGQTFQVFHREEFMKSILPKYFKHNNFASFVRQLNMYGWHKVQDVTSGSMAKDEKNQEEVWQFKNPSFIRGREDLLDNIVRNRTGGLEEAQDQNVNFLLILSELDQIRMNQIAIIEDMRRIRKDNQTLWNENYATRERHQKQTQTLDKIMKFLAAVYGNSAGKIFEVEHAPFDQHYQNQLSTLYNGAPSPRPSYPQPAPILKSRLMLMDQAYLKLPSSSGASPNGTSGSVPPPPGTSQSVPPSHNPSVSTGKDSIEEIVRNDGTQLHPPQDDAAAMNANRIYQQIMNQDPAGNSPRHLFSDLHLLPGTPTQQFSKLNGGEHGPDSLLGLEQNIFKQGQALLQVQDWIQTLSSRQQQQQQQLQQQKLQSPSGGHPDLEDFDVDEFLNNNQSQGNGGSLTPEHLDADNGEEVQGEKRHIEEVDDESKAKKARR